MNTSPNRITKHQDRPRKRRLPSKVVFGLGYCTVAFQGIEEYNTPRRGKAYGILADAWMRFTPWVSERFIMEELGTPRSRLKDTFKRSALWGKLIVRCPEKPGFLGLNL
jgi:hypothetical protein